MINILYYIYNKKIELLYEIHCEVFSGHSVVTVPNIV